MTFPRQEALSSTFTFTFTLPIYENNWTVIDNTKLMIMMLLLMMMLQRLAVPTRR